MLEQYKQSCELTANRIPNWKKLSKNELCNLYIENEDDTYKAEAYFAAIVYKYWGTIEKFYWISSNVVEEESVYEWMVDSIMYALKHRSWTKETSSIYNDPCGPDKVINRCMKCRRYTYYQAINRKKRKDSFGSLSLDLISEQTKDCNTAFEDDGECMSDTINSISRAQMVEYYYKNQQILLAHVLDCIMYGRVFVHSKDGQIRFDETRLISELINMDKQQLTEFANRYGFDSKEVISNWKNKLRYTPRALMETFVANCLKTLRTSKFFIGSY